ncbi:MAG: DNA translocase FtsK 4TM domain-containing protein [Candidatus Gracilibacteria bacterium]
MAKRRKRSTSALERRGSTRKRKSRGASRPLSFEVKSTVARDISAVVYFLIAAVMVLSLQGNFGVVGDMLTGIFRPTLGYGVWLIPLIFGFVSIMLFFSKSIEFGLSRIVGIGTLTVSILSVLHLYVDVNELHSAASSGQYGGYVGFVMNFLMRGVLQIGHVGASIVFIAMFLIGTMLTLQVSLSQIFSFLRGSLAIRKIMVESAEDEEEDSESEEDDEPEIFIRKNQLADEVLAELANKVQAGAYDEAERVRTLRIDMNEHRGEEDIVLQEVKPEKAKKGKKEDAVAEEAVEVDPETGEIIVKNNIEVEKAEEIPEFFWEYPSLDLLNPAVKSARVDESMLRDTAEKIKSKFKQFDIDVVMHEVNVGPTVIQYTLRPHEGVKLSKLTNLKNDIALALAAKAVRIEAPIPGKSLVGIEIPNDKRTAVHLREILESKEFAEVDSNLRFPIGRDVSGKPVIGDLASMPHLLIAGSTGSGKSVGMNALLMSLIYQNGPDDLKLIMIDPKRVELDLYNGIPHLLTPVITEPEKAAIALRWAVAEMTRRYKLLSVARQRNIADYMAALGPDDVGERLPKIVIVIDELADLMMTAKSEVEASICRIAQMARAVGIHLVIATQRPSVDVITGLIKANIPSRISFAVSSSIDSRTILDAIGAEDLLGRGDMLYLPGGMAKPQRVQGIYVSTAEIERVTNHAKTTMPPQYDEGITNRKMADESVMGVPDSKYATPDEDMDDDQMVKEAIKLVIESRKASASLLQRRLKVGYARAARLLDVMEERGYIGPSQGAKAREIYVNDVPADVPEEI